MQSQNHKMPATARMVREIMPKVGWNCTFFSSWMQPGQEKSSKFPTLEAHISVVFHSFRLIFERAIISRSALDAWMLSLEQSRAEHSR